MTTVHITKNNLSHEAHVLEERAGEIYVHYVGTDKRLDEWVPAAAVTTPPTPASRPGSPARKRRRVSTRAESPIVIELDDDGEIMEDSAAPTPPAPADDAAAAAGPAVDTEEFDIAHHRQITARRNFDKVNFGHWQIKTWYFSPYPLAETEGGEGESVALPEPRIPGVARATGRSHGRTSDLLAGGLGRAHDAGGAGVLWVCDRCFKYMLDGTSWEAHTKRCTRKHPPGRKVYQRGAHTIWEVDGAKEKLYCQNLSLFGKLFIDIKTLFFDCDNFLFYIFTDAEPQRDHVLGFFSKVSYDDYNLACIIVLPPYQRQGYGMLMIEFSYEISRRSGRVGTPERPLSDLGLRSYLAYWVSTLIRFFRRLLTVLPPDLPKIPALDTSAFAPLSATKRRRSAKGWDGESTSPAPGDDTAALATLRRVESAPNADGSATTHVVVRCALADVARATHLRVEDAAFALNECGLLIRRVKSEEDVGEGEGDEGSVGDMVVISREMVEAVAKKRVVKRMCMERARVLL
ncbi:acyl-CoA N-acyltransferase [Auriscalpium vulgare]|uniref:Acyl-CoA N-acyltransferase n=1 Tax=Auriscalpium vulgare TaxID=40419 RepID=A0ACB8REW1_9AGAM|nr:acyl-CoA N-acyltransferase [Auriscalpium vulgare]